MPAAVAARPRDERGYPVPAVTPWPDGRPEFARQSTPRTLVCLDERRCVVCGTKMPPGPVYRPVDGEAADLIAALEKCAAAHRDPTDPRSFHGPVSLAQIDERLYSATDEAR